LAKGICRDRPEKVISHHSKTLLPGQSGIILR
jgi:hypothetical protein